LEEKNEESQITIFRHVLEQEIRFKIRNIILILSAIILFGSGFSLAQIFNMKWVMRSYDTGYKTAIAENPAATYASQGITFCFDGKGNYHKAVKKGSYFSITKDQSRAMREAPKVEGE
jgi:hypothetical protein